jgi:hypothetical protein
LGDSMENSFHFFPLWKRGMKGDLTAFQKAKLLQKMKFRVSSSEFRVEVIRIKELVLNPKLETGGL